LILAPIKKVVNVYSKSIFNDKRQLWSDLVMSRRGFGGCCWCIVGEFNSVRESSERRGVGQSIPAVYSQEMLGFEDLELIDLPLVGRRFVTTRFSKSRKGTIFFFFFVHNQSYA
jgi:hypothetical protein